MKKLALLTIPLLALIFTAGGITASAADGNTIYPEDDKFVKTLAFTSLTDYAIEDNLFAFADGRMVKVYKDGNYTEYAFENKVLDVDIKDGVIYCGCSDEKAYTVVDQGMCEYTFPEDQSEILFNGFYYFIDESGLNIFNRSTKENAIYDGEYINLKQYGDKVYAMNGNSLYEFNGSDGSELMLEYAVDKSELKITIGQAAYTLKQYAPVQFVEIEEGSYVTEIDLDNLSGEYFVPLSIIKTEVSAPALLLCYSGNAAIVAIRGTAYAVLKSKVREIEIDCTAEKPFENAQMIGGNIYASPYVVSGTVATSNATGITVKVISRIEHEILECAFYEVEYTLGGKSVKGYVAEGFLSKVIIEDDKEPTLKTDPNYSDSSDTKTILIIFAVVVLVLAAVAYIAHVGSKGKKKDKKKKDRESEE